MTHMAAIFNKSLGQNGLSFADDIFKFISICENSYCKSNFTEVCFHSAIIDCSIGLENGLLPNTWQAIIWTNDDQGTDPYMHHPASMSTEKENG